ncbi:MAG: tetratricopeptide repeat protein [Bacteroidales bacterium]|nr:tetratricopeptide repeat protein [Bacteroidales bacterium]
MKLKSTIKDILNLRIIKQVFMPYKNNKVMKVITILTISLFLLISSSFSQGFAEDFSSFEKSINYELEGDYTQAISALKRTYSEKSYEYNYRLGWLDYLAGQYTESTTYYNKAISLMPMSIEARFGLISPLLALGKTNLAIDIYLEILEIAPNDTKANYRLGLILYQQEKYKEAEIYLKKIINIYPFDYDTLVLLGWNSLKMGKEKQARLLFQKALLYYPNDESAAEGLRQL